MLIQRVLWFLCILFPLTSQAAYQDVATLQQNSFSRYIKISFGACCALALLRLCKKIDLLSAIQQGDLRTIKLFVFMGGNINALINGHHPLVFAAQYGHTTGIKQIEIIKYLLDQGAYVEAISLDGNTALIAAAQAGNYWALATLLNARADIEQRNQLGNTALLCAVQESVASTDLRHNYLTCIELLIKHNACIETPNASGVTPIRLATAFKLPNVIDALTIKR